MKRIFRAAVVSNLSIRCVVLAMLLACCIDGYARALPDLQVPKDSQTSTSERAVDRREVAVGIPIANGTVIVHGEVLKSPFRISQRGREVFVNGVSIAQLPSKRGDRTRVNQKHFVAHLESRLYNGDVLVCFDDRTRVIFCQGDEAFFLQALIDAETIDERVIAVLDHSIENDEQGDLAQVPTSQWRVALADFEATDSLLQHLVEVGMTDESEDTSPQNQEGLYRSDPTRWMYLLNVVGMFLVVVSFGMLLRDRPEVGIPWSQVVDSENVKRLARHAAILILLLSLFDLVATLVTSTTGGFTELNPMTGTLIKSPILLAGFKLTATGLGVGILWHRRKYAGAQQAVWWMCLVLTLVTIRWVTIQSLFYV